MMLALAVQWHYADEQQRLGAQLRRPRTVRESAVLDVMRHGEIYSPLDIAAKTGLKTANAGVICMRMARRKMLVRHGESSHPKRYTLA